VTWDRIQGNWRRLKGVARTQWSRLTSDYAGVVAGKRQERFGKIQATYAIARKADEKRLAEWLARQHKVDPIHK
jgi:uncharacterized protein YjbJ (UPF0337 family)